MNEETLKVIVLFGLPMLAAIVGYYFVNKLAKKEEREKAQSIKEK